MKKTPKTKRSDSDSKVNNQQNKGPGGFIIALSVVLCLLVVIGLVYICFSGIVQQKSRKYEQACDYLENKKYTYAIKLFRELGDYKDSAEKAENISLELTGKKDAYFYYEESSGYFIITEDGDLTVNSSRGLPEGVLTIPDVVNDIVVRSIGKGAFSGADGLREVTIPDTVVTICENAFTNCARLEKIDFGKKLESIDKNAFAGCAALTEITLPDYVSRIGAMAFMNCGSLRIVNLPVSLTVISEYMFSGCSELSILNIVGKITSIESNAFAGCRKLTSINLPATLKSIGGFAFEQCGSLEEITLPDSVTELGSGAFSGCGALKKVRLGTGIATIRNYTFEDCVSLEHLTFTKETKTIAYSAFGNCKLIADIDFYGSAEDFGVIDIADGNDYLKAIEKINYISGK